MSVVEVHCPYFYPKKGEPESDWIRRPEWAQPIRFGLEPFDPPYKVRNRVSGTIYRPVYVLGIVLPTTTVSRRSAPSPLSKFSTTHYPMDKGHLFGLSLGGCDITENIIPQYRSSNQNGEWREMEIEIETNSIAYYGIHNALSRADWNNFSRVIEPVVMVIELDYSRSRNACIPNAMMVQVQFGTEIDVYTIDNELGERDYNIINKLTSITEQREGLHVPGYESLECEDFDPSQPALWWYEEEDGSGLTIADFDFEEDDDAADPDYVDHPTPMEDD